MSTRAHTGERSRLLKNPLQNWEISLVRALLLNSQDRDQGL
jgi:hypothetical protein